MACNNVTVAAEHQLNVSNYTTEIIFVDHVDANQRNHANNAGCRNLCGNVKKAGTFLNTFIKSISDVDKHFAHSYVTVNENLDYFDMDCENIDEHDSDDDHYKESSFVNRTQTSRRNTRRQYDTLKDDQMSSRDVTVISDDENDGDKRDSSLLNKYRNQLENNSSVGIPNSGKKVQSATEEFQTIQCDQKSIGYGNHKIAANKIANKGVKKWDGKKGGIDNSEMREDEVVHDQQSAKNTAQTAASVFSCPSIDDELDSITDVNMTKTRNKLQEMSSNDMPRNSLSDLGHSSARSLHKGDGANQKSKEIQAFDSSTTPLMLSLSNESIFVSSGLMHGCIPSLLSVNNVQSISNAIMTRYADTSVTNTSLSNPQLLSRRDSFAHLVSEDMPEFLALNNENKMMYASPSHYNEYLWNQPGSSFEDETVERSPPSKRRLLDFDKKWHMQPKYSLEQEKYVALPGGIEGSFVEADRKKWKKVFLEPSAYGEGEWWVPGQYTNISHYPSIPSVEIESVDSSYMYNVEDYYTMAQPPGNLTQVDTFETDNKCQGIKDVKIRGQGSGSTQKPGRGIRKSGRGLKEMQRILLNVSGRGCATSSTRGRGRIKGRGGIISRGRIRGGGGIIGRGRIRGRGGIISRGRIRGRGGIICRGGIRGRGSRGGKTLNTDVWKQKKVKSEISNTVTETDTLNFNAPKNIISEEKENGGKIGFFSLKKFNIAGTNFAVRGKRGRHPKEGTDTSTSKIKIKKDKNKLCNIQVIESSPHDIQGLNINVFKAKSPVSGRGSRGVSKASRGYGPRSIRVTKGRRKGTIISDVKD